MLDHPLVVGRDGRELGGAERSFEQPGVGAVDVALLAMRHAGRLEVRAFAETKVRPEREERLEIVRRPVEIRLKHEADVVGAAPAQPPVEAKSAVDVPRLLHVHADEVRVTCCDATERREVLVRHLVVQAEAEVRRLHGEIRT